MLLRCYVAALGTPPGAPLGTVALVPRKFRATLSPDHGVKVAIRRAIVAA